MMRLFSVVSVATLVSLVHGQESGCNATTSSFIAAEAPDHNNQVVSNLLTNIKSLRAPGTAYAAFDWDNTCMFGDISHTIVYHQVNNLNYRISPSQFKQLLSQGYTAENGDACLPLGINSVLGQDVTGKNVTLAESLESTSNDYQALYDMYISPFYKLENSGKEAPSLDTVKETEVYRNFRAKLAFLVFKLEYIYGSQDEVACAMKLGMTTLPQLLVGMTEQEIQQNIRSSVRWHLNAKLESLPFTSTGSLAVKGNYEMGLRVFNGQESTMRALRQQGVEVYVISASPQVFVREVASLMGLSYVVPTSNVFGVRFSYKDNKFTGQLIDNYPLTWGPGKAEIITKWIAPKHQGAAPIYASGDSNGDVGFLNQVRDGVVHVNNRLMDKPNKIQTLYEKACYYFDTVEPGTNNRYLLQGQDKEIGTWINSGFTTKNGVEYISGASTKDACIAYKF